MTRAREDETKGRRERGKTRATKGRRGRRDGERRQDNGAVERVLSTLDGHCARNSCAMV